MEKITKALLSTAAAGFLVAGSLAGMTASAQGRGAPAQQQNQNQDSDRGDQNRGWDQHRDRDRDRSDRCRDDHDQRGDRGDRGDCDTRFHQRDDRQIWRDDRRDARWDGTQHNGYYVGNTWYYGPPSSDHGRRNIVLGYHPWAVGERLGYYNGRYKEVDFRSNNLKRPNRGYHWVRDDRGVFILARISNGYISQVLNRSARRS